MGKTTKCFEEGILDWHGIETNSLIFTNSFFLFLGVIREEIGAQIWWLVSSSKQGAEASEN